MRNVARVGPQPVTRGHVFRTPPLATRGLTRLADYGLTSEVRASARAGGRRLSGRRLPILSPSPAGHFVDSKVYTPSLRLCLTKVIT